MKQNAKGGFKKAKSEDAALRDSKTPTKQRREQTLRHAVRHREYEMLEDYDEFDV